VPSVCNAVGLLIQALPCLHPFSASDDKGIETYLHIERERERERDNVVYWKTKRKINDDLQLHIYLFSNVLDRRRCIPCSRSTSLHQPQMTHVFAESRIGALSHALRYALHMHRQNLVLFEVKIAFIIARKEIM